MRRADNKHRETKVGIAWYRPEQWERLREVSVDREKLEDTHAEWLAEAEKAFAGLQRAGLALEKVEMDVEELVLWCARQGIPTNAKSRVQFVTEMIQKKYEPREKPPSL